MTSLEQELKIPQDANLDVREVASLTCVSDDNTGSTIAIDIGSSTLAHEKDRRFLVVGRQAAVADIRIDHKSLSRKHAVLYYTGNRDGEDYRLLLCDLGTKKGTKVNGVTIAQPTPLYPRDTVQFGVAHPIFTIKWDREKDNHRRYSKNIAQPQATLKEEETLPQEEQAAAAAIVEPLAPQEEKEQEQEIPEPGAGLTGRAKRQAEIAAMMASLEAQPTYQTFVPSNTNTEPEPQPTEEQSFQRPQEPSQIQDYDTSMAQKHKLPLSDTLHLEHNASTISCIAMDPTGARFAVGSSDTNVRIYDFAGMNALKPLPFGTFTVQDGYPIQALCYSPNGDRLLVATGSAQPKVLNRDGQEIVQLVRGDVYVTDPTKTIGHTATVTCVAWHPLEKDIVITGSMDGSVRWWDLKKGRRQFSMLTCSNIVAIKSSKGRKTAVTSLAFSPGGREVAVGTLCGSIQIWNPIQSKLRPQRAVYPAAASSTEKNADAVAAPIYSLVFSIDGSHLASRSTQSCSVWNAAKLSKSSKPLVDYQGVALDDTSTMETSTIAFSPNGKVLCVPCCPDPKQPCILKFFAVASDKTTPLLEYPLSSSSVVGMAAVQWHVKLNQLLVASGHHDGLLQVLYSPQASKKGALLTAGIQRHKRAEDDLQQLYDSRAPKGTPVSYGEILTPNALPLFQPEGHASKKNKRKQLDDATATSRNPEPPRKGFRATTQGGVGSTFTQFIVDSTQGGTKSMAGMDPREALFQYQKGKSFISSAYKGNKEHVMAEKTMEQEEDELNEEANK